MKKRHEKKKNKNNIQLNKYDIVPHGAMIIYNKVFDIQTFGGRFYGGNHSDENDVLEKGVGGRYLIWHSAGSGKTMVMLHRLSYLMYNNDDIKSRDVLDENYSFLLISAYTTGVSPTSLKNIL